MLNFIGFARGNKFYGMVTLQPFDTEEEALEIANGTNASIWLNLVSLG